MLVLGIIVCVVGAFLIFNYFNQKKRLEAISGVETSTAALLHEICQGVASEIGKGSFEQMAEVKGTIQCDQPLESEIEKQPCAYYSMTVTRKWEEEYYEKDKETGETVKKTRQGSDIVSSNTRSVPFKVKDDTGTLLVDPNDARIEGEQIVDRFEPQEGSASGGTISFGSFSFSFGEQESDEGRRTLGYHFSETILPLNRKAYVLGSASDLSGELMIQKPREKGQFLISLKSEEELMASSKSGMQWSLYGAIACFVIGVILIILNFVQG